jgi:hypothetical protein
MLLRRITEHFRTQNWVAVALDLVVVVVGIFLGFQVERWYESQRLMSEEEDHLIALRADFAAERTDLEWLIDRWHSAAEAGQTLLNLDAEADTTITNVEFYRLVGAVQRSGNLESNRQTYDTLIATGNIEYLRDDELRSKLGEYYSSVDRMIQGRARWDSEMAMLWEPFVKENLDRVMLIKSEHPDESGHLSPSHASDRYLQVIGSDDFESVIAKRWHFYNDRGFGYRRLLKSSVQIEEIIAENLKILESSEN